MTAGGGGVWKRSSLETASGPSVANSYSTCLHPCTSGGGGNQWGFYILVYVRVVCPRVKRVSEQSYVSCQEWVTL